MQSPVTTEEPRHVALEHMAFFHGFPAAMLAALRPLGHDERYPAESYLLREGEEANRFYIIRDGVVTIASKEDQDASPIQTLGVGEAVGWSWLSPPFVWSFDAITRTETTVLAFDASQLRNLCDTHPEWGYVFMRRLAYVFAMRLKHMRELWRNEHMTQIPPH